MRTVRQLKLQADEIVSCGWGWGIHGGSGYVREAGGISWVGGIFFVFFLFFSGNSKRAENSLVLRPFVE